MVLFRVSWGVPGLEWEQAGSTGKHVGLEKSRNTITDRYGKLSYEKWMLNANKQGSGLLVEDTKPGDLSHLICKTGERGPL